MSNQQRNMTYVISGQDKSGGKTLGDIATQGEASTKRLSSAFSKVGSTIGGEFGDVLTHIGDGFDTLSEKGSTMAGKMIGAGAGLAGVGAVLTTIGSAEKQAQDQLSQAITDTGGSISDYQGQIEKTISKQEDFGHSAKDTDEALTTLTQSTQDPKKALADMGLAADLAASKHESLSAASQQLAKILAGSGSRTLKSYGITTTDTSLAIQQLSQRLSGQASASMDNWSGKLKIAETKVSDFVATIGEKYGPALTMAGSALTAAGAVSELWGKHVANSAKTAAEAAGKETAAVDEVTVSEDANAVSAARLSAANTRLAGSQAEVAETGTASKGSMLAGTGALVGLTAGFVMGGKAIADYVDKGSALPYLIGGGLKNAVASLDTALINTSGSTADVSKQWAAAQIQATGLADKAAKVGITTDQLSAAITGGAGATSKLIDQWKASGNPSSLTITQLQLLSQQYGVTADKVNKLKASQQATPPVVAAVNSQFGVLQSTVDSVNKSIATQAATNASNTLQLQLENDAATLTSDAFSTLNDKTMSAEEANLSFKDAVSAADAAIKQNGKSLSDNTDKGRQNVEMVLSAVQAAQAHAEAVGKQTGSTEKASATFLSDVSALKQHLIALGYNSTAVDTLIAQYAKLPPVKKTEVDIIGDAAAELDGIITRVGRLRGAQVSVKVSELQDVHNMNAAGTDYFSGGSTTFNERHGDPEAIVPRGYSITPVSRVGHGAGNFTHVEVTVQAMPGNEQAAGRAIAKVLEEYVGSGGTMAIGRGING